MNTADTTDMADFYIGRGPSARYLGSVPRDASPEQIDAWEIFQSLDEGEYTQDGYAYVVIELIEKRRGQHAKDTAPAARPPTERTPWTYMWEAGTVWIYYFGVEMALIRCNYTRSAPRVEHLDGGGHLVHPGERIRKPRDTASTFRTPKDHAHA